MAERNAREAAQRGAFEERVRALIERASAFAHGPSAALVGVAREIAWTGDVNAAVTAAGADFARLLRVPLLAEGSAWGAAVDAAPVLPAWPLAEAAKDPHAVTPWVLALGWLATRALGAAIDAAHPEVAAALAFEQLRLSRGVHEALSWRGLGGSDSERWRYAALVHCALAHPHWHAGAPAAAPAPWLDDPEACWLIHVHESSGTQWFSREYHAQLVWWRVLPELLAATDATATARPAALSRAQAWATAQLERAESSQWHYEALVSGTSPATVARPGKVRDALAPDR